jgi:hypothetical protein
MWPFGKGTRTNHTLQRAKANYNLVGDVPWHWPTLVIDDLAEGDNLYSYNLIRFVHCAKKAFQGSSIEVVASDTTCLSEEGVVEIPLRISEGQQTYDVFFYPEPNLDAAAHFQAVKALAARTGLLNPVYYSRELLEQKPQKRLPNVARTDYLFLDPSPECYPEDHFAMWWPQHDTHSFAASPAYRYLDEAYKQIEGIESYLAAHIARRIGLIELDKSLNRLPLPEETIKATVRGPQGVLMIVSICKEKGIRFHFPVEHTDPIYRDRFLKLWLEHVKYIRQVILDRNLPLDEAGAERSIDWWNYFKESMSQQEKERTWRTEAFGLIRG